MEKELESLFLELFAKQFNGDYERLFCNKVQQLKSKGYSFYKTDRDDRFKNIIELELPKSQFLENPPSLSDYLEQKKAEYINKQEFDTAERVKSMITDVESIFPELKKHKVNIYSSILKLTLGIKLNNKQFEVYIKSNSYKFNYILREAMGMNIFTS